MTTVANRVKEHGSKFEQVLKHRERDNPKFAFLYDSRVSFRWILGGLFVCVQSLSASFCTQLPAYHLFLLVARPGYKCPYADVPFQDEVSIATEDAENGVTDRLWMHREAIQFTLQTRAKSRSGNAFEREVSAVWLRRGSPVC